ncbi:hypothetical protein F441_01212, partial [Phytophthora nicotianae CJ01A1]
EPRYLSFPNERQSHLREVLLHLSLTRHYYQNKALYNLNQALHHLTALSPAREHH